MENTPTSVSLANVNDNFTERPIELCFNHFDLYQNPEKFEEDLNTFIGEFEEYKPHQHQTAFYYSHRIR